MNMEDAPELYKNWQKEFEFTITEDPYSIDTHHYHSRIIGINISKSLRYDSKYKLNWN